MSTLSFQYKAVDKAGAEKAGTIRAATRLDAFRQVAAQGLTPLTITAQHTRVGGRGRVKPKDIAHFTYQLSVLIGARIPIGEGLRTIAEQEPKGRFREVIMNIASRIDSGEQIAGAMDEYRPIFGDIYVETVRAAERSGNLVKVLEYLSEMLERSEENRSQIKSALMYPICVVSVLGLAVTFLIGFVIPKFAKLFEARGVELPIFTKIMVAIGDSVQGFWWAYLAAAAGVVFGIKAMRRSAAGRATIDLALHRTPYIRKILVGVAVARFTRVFGLCVSSGLGLIEALEMAGRASGSSLLLRDVQRMVEQVRSGGRLSKVLVECAYLPGFARRMLAAGEESADLGRMCTIVTRQYERESAALAKNIATVVEPVLVVALAGVVLVVALSIFLPMWNMTALIG